MPTGILNIGRLRTIRTGGDRSNSSSPSLSSYGFSNESELEPLFPGRVDEKNPPLDWEDGEKGTKEGSVDGKRSESLTQEDATKTNGSLVLVDQEIMKSRQRGSPSRAGPVVLVPISPKKLNKRRSCESSLKMSPCIEKATFHLYQLQDKISGNSSNFSNMDIRPGQGALSVGYPHSFYLTQKKQTGKIQLKPLRKSNNEESTLQTELLDASGNQILGAGYVIPNKDTDLVTFLQSVVDEHLTLLGRLETDRYNTEQALLFERERVKKLEKKIYDLAYKRMLELPVAVQAEHEACAYDIQELKWHVSQRQRLQMKAKEKLRQAEISYNELAAKIGHIEGHSPSVEEKLKMDREDMEKIKRLQEETDRQLAEATKQLEKMEKKYSDATTTADDEKDVINAELGVIKDNLSGITEVRDECLAFQNSYNEKLQDGKMRLAANEDELAAIERRLASLMEHEKVKRDEITGLKKSIADQEKEHNLLEEENTRLDNERKELVARMTIENATLELDNKKAVKELRELMNTNRTTEREIREIKKSTVRWNKQQVENEKSVKRAAQEMAKLERELQIIEEENSRLRVRNEQLNSNLNHFKENSAFQEESLNATLDNVSKQLKDEVHARTVLQAKIAAESTDFVRIQDEGDKKKEKATKRANEVIDLVANLKSQVDKLEKAHTDRLKVIAEIVKITDIVKEQHQQTEKSLKEKIDELRPKQEKNQDELNTITGTRKDMAWRSEAMHKKMNDMHTSTEMMDRLIRVNHGAISELSEELDELKIQIENRQQVESSIKNSLESVEGRSNESKDDYSEHMKIRYEFFKEKETELKEILSINKTLANKYDITQNSFLARKHEFIQIYEKHLISDNNLRDQEGLCNLHYRLHDALECYYQLRGLTTRAGLAKFEHLNASNGERLAQIQNNMHATIKKISLFLNASRESQKLFKLQNEKLSFQITS